MRLRPYQIQSIDDIIASFISGKKKVLLHLATGAGKTVIFCEIFKRLSKKGKHGIMVVRGRELVNQGSDRLLREGVNHGVLMAGHPNYNPDLPIQVCSIDTIRSRSYRPKADLIVIDEAHMAISQSYKNFTADYPDAYILGVTATPFPNGDLTHIAETVIHPISVRDLINQGYLVNAVYFAPSVPDLSHVSVSRGTFGKKEYNIQELSEACNTIVGDVVTQWIKLAKDTKTICFGVDIAHSKMLVDRFKDNGINALHIEADTKDGERKEALRKLESGEIKVISNVGILCTGVDIPFLQTIIMARPTLSYSLYIQQAGRGTRPYPGKESFLLLDHAGNVCRHGFITDEREAKLKWDGSEKTASVPLIKTCPECFAVFSPYEKACPLCGYEDENTTRQVINLDGELKLLTPNDISSMKIIRDVNRLKEIARKRGYKQGWLWHKVKEQYGENTANFFFPKREYSDFVKNMLIEKGYKFN